MGSLVVGADGAPGGWLLAELTLTSGTDAGVVRFSFAESLAPTVERLTSNDVAVLAVDMPIGLSADGNRPADQQARERLGPRRSTFFPSPIRSLLDIDDYAEANAHSKASIGSGLSKQAWNLMPKVRHVDSLWTAEISDRLLEAHPETSFAELAREPVMTKKASLEGRAERVALLRGEFGDPFETSLNELRKALWVDAIDATIAAWTARRVWRGEAVQLGGELDPAGRPMRLSI